MYQDQLVGGTADVYGQLISFEEFRLDRWPNDNPECPTAVRSMLNGDRYEITVNYRIMDLRRSSFDLFFGHSQFKLQSRDQCVQNCLHPEQGSGQRNRN